MKVHDLIGKRIGAVVLWAALMAIGFSAAAQTTWDVPNDFANIQTAVNSASVVNGDIIEVTVPGNEPAGVVSSKNLIIRNVSAGVYQFNNQSNVTGGVVITFDGFDIVSPNFGLYVDNASSVTFRNGSIVSTGSVALGTGGSSAGANVTIENCTIRSDAVNTIQLQGSPTVNLINCDITAPGTSRDGVWTNSSPTVNIVNSRVQNCTRVGVGLFGAATCHISGGSVISGNAQDGIWFNQPVTLTVTDSDINANTQIGIRMQAVGSDVTLTGSRVFNNGSDQLFSNTGLDLVVDSTEVFGGTRGIRRQGNAGQATSIEIRNGSNFHDASVTQVDLVEEATLTISDSTLSGGERGVFMRDRAVGPLNATNSNFTGGSDCGIRLEALGAVANITGGTLNGSTIGLYVVRGATVLVDGSTIDGNTYGILRNYNAGQAVDITVRNGATISNSGGPGIQILEAADVRVQGSSITSSGNFGIEIDEDGSSVTLEGATLSDNAVRGVIMRTGGSLTLDGTTISGGDIGLQREGNAGQATAIAIRNGSTITGANFYGIDVIDQADITIADSSVSQNGQIGLLVRDRGTLPIVATNSAISSNSVDGIRLQVDGAQLSLTGCNVDGNTQKGINILNGATVGLDSTSVSNNGQEGVLRAGSAGQATAINVTNGSTISGNGNRGLDLVEQTTLTCDGSSFNGNSDYGIWLRDRMDVASEITNCAFDGNQDGLRTNAVLDLTLTTCTITNSSQQGVRMLRGGNLVVQGCDFDGNGIDIQRQASGGDATTIAIADTTLANCSFYALDLQEPADVTLSDTDLTSPGQIGVYVRGNMLGSLAISGGTVSGTTFGGVDVRRPIDVTLAGVTLSDNPGSACRIDANGATMTLTACDIVNNGGSGVSLLTGAALSLDQCNLTGNNIGVNRSGGAGQPCTIDITRSTLDGGTFYGLNTTEIAEISISTTTLSGNDSIGLYVRDRAGGTVELTNARLIGNGENAVRIDNVLTSDVTLTFNRCDFFDDPTSTGEDLVLLLNARADATFTNCVFDEGNIMLRVRNDQPNGTVTSADVRHCTFISREGVAARGVSAEAATSTETVTVNVVNSIVDGPQTGVSATGLGAATLDLAYSLVNGTDTALNGNVNVGAGVFEDVEPGFADATTGPGSVTPIPVQAASPALGGADPNPLSPPVTVDRALAARPQPAATNNDMGAYEFGVGLTAARAPWWLY